MSLITEAIKKLHYDIPEEILEETFLDKKYWQYQRLENIDAIIREQVVNARVLKDCNMVSGREIVVPLNGLQYDVVDNFNIIVRIPKSLTQGSTITQVLDISMGNMYGVTLGMHQPVPVSSYLQQASKLMDSNLPIPQVSNSTVEIVSENVIVLKGYTAMPPYLNLRCMIEYDSEFSTLGPRAFEAFYELLLFAVKNYIYVKLAIRIGQAKLSGGRELSIFKDIVDTYNDAGENYKTYLKEVWQKVAFLNDTVSRQRFHKIVAAI